MKSYLDLLQNIIDNGVEKESGRANMPNTIGISHGTIRMDLQEGFPLLTTKKMYWKGIVHELLWFLRGETNIKYLVDNNVNIWNGDAYRWYLKFRDANPAIMKDGREINNFDTIEYFIEAIKSGIGIAHLDVREKEWYPGYQLGDLGKVYGYQWRNQNGVDQIKEVLDGLKTNPYSRYHIIDGWNKADFKDMALPPCHLLYQFIVRPLSLKERLDYHFNVEKGEFFLTGDEKETIAYLDACNIPKFYLDLNMYQRSCDTLLGVPFNIASMSILLKLFAKANNMLDGVATWIGGDTHLYVNHLDAVKEQLSRLPYDLPELIITKELNSLEDILELTIDDFQLKGYTYHPAIKAELFTGLKK
jgi:thymidylate synthase